jgi:hypothetical protein
VLPVLLDFSLGFPALDRSATAETRAVWKTGDSQVPPGWAKGGRGEMFRDPQHMQQLLERVVAPVLDLAGRYRDRVYAVELMNEPEWIVRGSRLGRPWVSLAEHAKVAQEAMTELFRLGLAAIDQAGFRSTIGFTNARMLTAWRGQLGAVLAPLDGFVPQFHYYPSASKDFWGRAETLDHTGEPMILGEFSTTGAPWPDLDSPDIFESNQSIAARLLFADRRGYALAMPWSYRAKDEHTGDWGMLAAEIGRFREGQSG